MARLTNQHVGIILIVVGVLCLTGIFNGIALVAAGVALVVLGILMLMRKVQGNTPAAIVLVVLGVLVLAQLLPGLEKVVGILLAAVGIICIVVGILKLMDKM